MTSHDKIRLERALACDETNLESLLDALAGLQSTDDPALVPLHDRLMEKYLALREQQELVKKE